MEIVDIPNKHGDFPVRYVNLPEGMAYRESFGILWFRTDYY